MNELVAWLRRCIGMAVQSARALDKPVGGVLSQHSPLQLQALHEGHYVLLDHLVKAGDEKGTRLLAECYQLYSGYREEWKP